MDHAAMEALIRDELQTGTYNVDRVLNDERYAKAMLTRMKEDADRMKRDGIQPEDLKAAYDRGYANARADMTEYYRRFFFSAVGIAAHEMLGFGRRRCLRLMQKMYEIITDELTSKDIIDRCARETGIKIVEEDYADGGMFE